LQAMQPARILETSLYASDLAAAERFYTRVIGLEVHSRAEGRHVFFRAGDGMLLVFDPNRTQSEPTTTGGEIVPLHGAKGAGHAAFAVAESEIAAWREHLEREGVQVESEVTWPAGGRSLYVRDPAGNSIELAPPGIWGLRS
jgi:catechol 2,3-dioxygenase-like lactoylglutathione lyase family enzyme